MLDAPSAIILPQLASGGLMPMPRKDNAASSRSTFPTPSAADTMIGAAAFGRTWRKITRPVPAPSADAEGDAGAVHGAAPDITAQVVGAQQECPRRRVIRQVEDVELPVRVEGGDERCRQRDDDQERQDAEAPRRRPMVEKTAPALLAQPAVAQRANGLGRDDERDEQCEPRAKRHAVAVSTSTPARTRRRGSAMPMRMSATRFPATTTVLAIKAVAVTSG